MFQAVCINKRRSLGQFETEEEAVKVAKTHRARTGHIIKVFDVDAKEQKRTGSELINDEVESAEEVDVTTTTDDD